VPRRSATALIGLTVLATLAFPASGAADTKTSAQVGAVVTEQSSPNVWLVEITWTSSCSGALPNTNWYGGHLYMIDTVTAERIYVGGVVDTSGHQTVTGKREWPAAAKKRVQHLIPELTIMCYQNSPLSGGPSVTVTGSPIVIPSIFGGGSGGGGGGGGFGGGGGSPTEPLAAGGCVLAVLGTNGADRLEGGAGHEVVIGFGGGDLMKAGDGHDCVVGGSGGDRIDGGRGDDRVTGGSGADLLVDRNGVNAFDAGAGKDSVFARNGARELVRCGSGKDRAQVDRRDRVRGCELVTYRGRIPEVR
jgi:Ca2+-binding RTX toxin-like protein